MKLYFLGGAMEIGGSCIYVRAAGRGILLDSGIRQSVSQDPLPDFRTIQAQGGLDAILVSHAHMDHIGTLPIISKEYPNAPIYMTVMTADLTRVLLYDSLKIMKYQEDEIPRYTEQDVLAMLNRIVPIRFQAETAIFDRMTATFYPAGHIAGASCIYLNTDEGTLFYSGDFASFSQRTIEGLRIPKLRPDIAIVESTYGDRLHANRQVEEKRLVELVKECVSNGWKVLIPAFALGRAQEVLLILRAAIQNQEIPSIPVFVDGMVRDINAMYTRNPTFLKNTLGKRILRGNEPFCTKEIQAVAPNQKREDLAALKGPAIFVSSSGMLTGGPSTLYARLLAPSENACIIITGYQDEESPGRQLLKLLNRPTPEASIETAAEAQISPADPLPDAAQPDLPRLTLNGVSVPVKCRIEQVGLSAHGDKSEITALLNTLAPRHIFLVHGNRDVIGTLGSEIASEDYRRHVYLPECGQEYDIQIRTKRKQNAFVPSFTMQEAKPFSPEDAKLLWDYWQEHYPGKFFPVSLIAMIWYGKRTEEEALLDNMQKILLESPYFTSHPRQLFLFGPRTPEEAAEALKAPELTIQELEPQLQELFQEYEYRKISYHQGEKRVVLQFDFPDSLNTKDFEEKAATFREATGWDVQKNPSVNHTAAGSLLTMLFPGRLKKISYFTDRKTYAATLSDQQESDAAAGTEFLKKTGWQLSINGVLLGSPASAGEDAGKSGQHETNRMDILPSPSAPKTPIEQNLAFSVSDIEFKGQPHAPEKKSLKQDSRGKYLEFAFISPAIGEKCRETLQQIADQTGWRIRIAEKINQNGLSRIAQTLCGQMEIPLVKNPSYLPGEQTLVLRIPESTCPEKLAQAAERFNRETGCTCRFLRV